MTGKPLTISREDLYELVWSKPMQELAAEFGISDVALAKRCRRLHIPVPGRGYWARVAAGQSPHRPKLPEREPEVMDYSALTVPDLAHGAVGDDSEPLFGLDEREGPAEREGEEIRKRLAALHLPASPSLLDVLPVVKRTAWSLKHQRRAEFTFQRGEKSGPVISIDASENALDRALLLADTMLRTADSLGWTFIAAPEPKEEGPSPSRGQAPTSPVIRRGVETKLGQLLVDGERISFRIEERLREEMRDPTAAELARERREYGYRAPRVNLVPTGALRVIRLDGYREPTRKTWYDRKGRLVEALIPEILTAFHELAMDIKAKRAEDERHQREQEEKERRQEALEARQEASAKLIEQLERDAGAWHRARFLRRYVRAARRALAALPLSAVEEREGEESQGAKVEGLELVGTVPPRLLRARFGKQTVDFLEWAEAYLNQLDPLHRLGRSEDYEPRRSTYYRADEEEFRKAFARLVGAYWEDAWKISADYSPEPEPSASAWLYSYREKSVFEVGGGSEECL